MYIRPHFTPAFFTATPPPAADPAKPGKGLGFRDKFQDKFVKTFRGDYKAAQLDYGRQLDDIVGFFKKNAQHVTPPISKDSVEAVESQFAQLKINLFDRKRDFFKDDKALVFGAGKDMFKSFRASLHDDSIPLQKRLDAIGTMAPQVAVCSGGLLTVLREGMYSLRFSTGGIKDTAYKATINTMDAMINQHVIAHHSKHPGNQIHFVNVYFNYMAFSLGIPPRDDPYALRAGAQISVEQFEACKQKVMAKLTPENLSGILADDYLGRMKGALAGAGIDTGAALKGDALTHAFSVSNNLAEGELQREFGLVSQEKYLQPEGDHYDYRLASDPTALKHHFLENLRDNKLANFGDSLKLGGAPRGGDVMQLGSMYWVNKEGDCKPMRVADLLHLRPAFMEAQLNAQGIPAAQHSQVMHDVLRQMSSLCQEKQLSSLPNDWLGRFAIRLLNQVPRDQQALGTALKLSTQLNDVRTIGLLARQGVDLNQPDADGLNAAMHAAKNGNHLALGALIQNGAAFDMRDQGGHTAAMYAMRAGRADTLAMLRDAGADLSVVAKGGYNGVTLAAHAGKADALRLLIKAGIPFDGADGAGFTPLAAAASLGHAEVLGVLIAAGADVNRPDHSGTTPVMSVAKRGDAAMLRALIAAGADVSRADHTGTTPVMLAAARGDTGMLRDLIAAGANINAADARGNTALIQSVGLHRNESADLLLRAGARLDIKNRNGLTASQVARREPDAPGMAALQYIKKADGNRLQRMYRRAAG